MVGAVAATVVGFTVLGSPAAHANAILHYTGNDFTAFLPPYTATDKVTATITLANPLGDNLPNTQVTPLAFSLSDGVQTITSLNATCATFAFSTNSVGLITHWGVQVTATIGGGNSLIDTFDTTVGTVHDEVI